MWASHKSYGLQQVSRGEGGAAKMTSPILFPKESKGMFVHYNSFEISWADNQ